MPPLLLLMLIPSIGAGIGAAIGLPIYASKRADGVNAAELEHEQAAERIEKDFGATVAKVALISLGGVLALSAVSHRNARKR